MARGEIKIPMSADTSGIEKAIQNGLIEPVEDAEDALKKLAKVDAGENLERDLKKAQDASEDFSRDLDDTRDKLKKLGYAAKDAGDDAKKGMDRASDGVDEFKSEANSTAREAAASFNGSAEDIADAFQEVAANALAGFGPLGAAAGLALAAGLGVFLAEIDKAKERVEAIQEAANNISVEALESGMDVESFMASTDQVMQRLQALQEEGQKEPRWFWEEDKTGLQEFNEDLRTTGETQADANDIFSLGNDELEDYTDTVRDHRDALQEEADELRTLKYEAGELTDAQQARLDLINEEIGANNRVIETLDKEMETREEAAERSSAWSEAGLDDAQKRADAEEEAAERIKSAQEDVAESALESYDSMRDAAYEKATADDAAFNVDTWLQYVEETRAQADAYKENLASMKLTPAEWENFLALPEDARQAIAASYGSAGEAGKERIRTALSDGGATAGTDATVGFEENFNPDAGVTVEADTADAEADISAVTDKKRTATIDVKTTGKAAAKDALDALAKKRHATIEADVNTSKATSGMSAWRRSQEARPITITANIRSGRTQLV